MTSGPRLTPRHPRETETLHAAPEMLEGARKAATPPPAAWPGWCTRHAWRSYQSHGISSPKQITVREESKYGVYAEGISGGYALRLA